MWLSGNSYFDLYYSETPYKLTYKNFKLIDTMKTTRIMIIVAAAVAAIACNKENVEPTNPEPAPSDGIVTFTAGFDMLGGSATRTNLAQNEVGEYTKMVWSAGDVIGVVDKNGEIQPFTTEAGGATAIFKGTADAPESTWYAFYPYNENARVNSTELKLLTKIPEIQYAKKDGVSDNVTLLRAMCSVSSNSFSFTHLCGLVRINVPDGCVAVTLEFPDAEQKYGLTGGIAVALNYGFDTYHTNMWYKSVTLVSPDGGAMEAGNYYLAVRPMNYTGKVLLTMRRNDGKISIIEAPGLQVGQGEVRPINVTPAWEDDLGAVIYNGEENDQFYYTGDNTLFQEVTTEKVVGGKSIRWELTKEVAWTGYLKFPVKQGANNLSMEKYYNDYALEYYVKANKTAIVANSNFWEIYYHNFIGESRKEDIAPIYRASVSSEKYKGINALDDTDWHRVSIPLKDYFDSKGYLNTIEMHIKPDSDGKVLNAKGSVFYVNDVRIIRKTATKTVTKPVTE